MPGLTNLVSLAEGAEIAVPSQAESADDPELLPDLANNSTMPGPTIDPTLFDSIPATIKAFRRFPSLLPSTLEGRAFLPATWKFGCASD